MPEALAMPNRYPDNEPWYDLRQFAVNEWQMNSPSSSFNFFAKVSGNEVTLQMHTRGGTAPQIIAPLPEWLLPEMGTSTNGFRTLPAFQRTVGAIVLELQVDGTIHAASWSGAISDGSNLNIVCQATYVRKAVL